MPLEDASTHPLLRYGGLVSAALGSPEKLPVERNALEPVMKAEQVRKSDAAVNLGRQTGDFAAGIT